jgi:predicted nucleotidyltransferase
MSASAPGPGAVDAEKSWQASLDETVAALQSALSANLYSVVLYGSAARGDFVPGVSDLNLLIVLHESTPAAHEALAAVVRSRPRLEPFVVGRPGFLRTARAFPAKFAAIRRTGRVLIGPDLLKDVPRFPELERFAAEQALRNVRLRLVYNFLKRGGDPISYTRFALNFVPGIYSALNTILELNGHSIPHVRDAQRALFVSTFNVDTGVLVELGQLKRKPQALTPAQVSSSHARLFTIVMSALAWLEERWPI